MLREAAKKEAQDAREVGGGAPTGWMPIGVLAGALFLSALATFFVSKSEKEQRRNEFSDTVQQIEENLRSRMDSYVTLLLGGAGLFAASEEVTPNEFAAFVARVNLGELFPGVQGVGFSQRFKKSEIARVEESMRRLGRSEFKVWPLEPDRPEYHSILFLEPLDRRNAGAVGFDMTTEPIRRAAMERARDSGLPAATGRVKLVQEISGPVQSGFLIYVPIYTGGNVPATVEERREKLQGYIYSPFRVGDLLDGIVGRGLKTRVTLRLYDERAPGAPLHTMNTSGREEEIPFLHRPFRETHIVPIAGRRWILNWESAPLFLGGGFGAGAVLIGITGLVLSGLLFNAVRNERHARAASEAAADELRKEQELLRLSEERFRLFLERAQEYAIILVDTEGRISSWNPGAERLFGYSDAEILGQPGSILFTPEDRAAGAPEQELARAREHGQSLDERWHERKDGSRFYASGALVSLRAEKSVHYGYAKILRDMTIRKENEEAIRQLNQQLEERVRARTAAVQELNAQMEAFTYSVVHDLRAPLRAMHGFSTALIDDYGAQFDPTARDFLKRITEAAQRMDELIQDLLDLSHVSRADIKLRRVDLTGVARQALTHLAEKISETGARVEVAEPLPEAIGDFKILTRVVENLLGNALKFTKPGVNAEVRVYGESRGDKVRLYVRDNGIGIHPEHQQRIFRVFERLHGHDVYPGTGMGLALVKKSMERLGGTVGVESHPGTGATFWIEAPAAPSREPEAAPEGPEKI
jgi:PAS domain S-box-containing protein